MRRKQELAHTPNAMKRKKNSYLLLEFLLALAILSLTLGPLIQAPLSHLKRQIQETVSLCLACEARQILYTTQEKLYHNAIPWKQIELAEKSPVFIGSQEVTFPGLPISPCQAEVFLSKAHIEKKDDTTDYGWVEVLVSFTPIQGKREKYALTFFISKQPIEISVDPQE